LKRKRVEDANTQLDKVAMSSTSYWALRNELLLKEHAVKMEYMAKTFEWKKQRHEAKMALLHNKMPSSVPQSGAASHSHMPSMSVLHNMMPPNGPLSEAASENHMLPNYSYGNSFLLPYLLKD
jgi:hypothetical protein